MELQRYIRGSGLAYGAYAGYDTEAGWVSFTLYRVRSGVI
jgi:Zn-dependent M16 (insulinase) family peptidase